MDMIKEKPILGYGYDKFRAEYMLHQAEYFSKQERSGHEIGLSDNVDYPYNEILHTAIEFGIIGLMLLVLLIYFIFDARSVDEKNTAFLIIGKSGLLSILVFSLFSYSSEILPISVLTIVFLSIIGKFSDIKYSMNLNFVQSLKIPRLLSVAALFVILILFCKVVNNNIKGYHIWGRASVYYERGLYDSSSKIYWSANELMRNEGMLLNHLGKALSMAGRYKQSIDILKESGNYLNNSFTYLSLGDNYKNIGEYKMAKESYLIASKMIPSHIYPKYCLANLYYLMGENINAFTMAADVISSDVKIESVGVDQIKKEMLDLEQKIKNKLKNGINSQ